MPSHQGSLGDQGHLVAASTQHRPLVVPAKQLIGDAFHVHEVFWVGANTAEHAQDKLQKDRPLDQASVHEVLEVIEVPDVVALELEPGAMGVAQAFEHFFDVTKGVAENAATGALDVVSLPVVFEGLELVERREEGEVDGAHVARRHLGRDIYSSGQTLVQRHGNSTAGGDVDDGIGGGMDLGQEQAVEGRIKGRAAVFGVAGMQVQDGGTSLSRRDRLTRNVFRCDGQVRRHARGVD